MPFQRWSMEKREQEYKILLSRYEKLKNLGLSLDMTRGKPSTEQVTLSDGLLRVLQKGEECRRNGYDARNYGQPRGIPEAISLFASLLDVKEEEVMVGGNSSLSLLYDALCRAVLFGADKNHPPWGKGTKILAPVPGYDRHFALCTALSMELIPVPLTGKGPDMDTVESLTKNDPTIKGILCVPKYANPTGETYSDETVERLAFLPTAAEDFRIFWDMAYLLHDHDENGERLKNIFDLIRGTPKKDSVLGFFSTSKMTYAGSGVAALIASPRNIAYAMEKNAYRQICPDKLNQLRHVLFLKDKETVSILMKRHGEILKPKFEAVEQVFSEELSEEDFITLSHPKGGYFLCLSCVAGTAKRTAALCGEAGVLLTSAGATHPHFLDPEDKILRLAPSCLSVSEAETAARVVALSARLAAAEKRLGLLE